MSIAHAKSNVIADVTGTATVYNSQGSTTTVAATDLVRPSDWNSAHAVTVGLYGNTTGNSSAGGADFALSATGGVTISGNGSTAVISVPNDATLFEFNPVPASSLLTNSSLGQNSLYFVPFDVPEGVSASRVNFFVSLATVMSAGNSTGEGGYTVSAAMYSKPPTSTDRIATFWSCTAAWRMTQSSNTRLVATNVVGINGGSVSSVGTSISDANASTYAANSMAGFRVLAMPVGSIMTPGRYWMGVAASTVSSNAGVCSIRGSFVMQTNAAGINFAPVGTSSSASNVAAGKAAAHPGAGTYSATSGAFPATIPLTSDSIRAGGALTFPFFNFSGYATGVATI